jgi:hypothetical protein
MDEDAFDYEEQDIKLDTTNEGEEFEEIDNEEIKEAKNTKNKFSI